MKEMQVQSLGEDDPLEKEMANHSSILAWEIPMERGAWRAQRIRHDLATKQQQNVSLSPFPVSSFIGLLPVIKPCLWILCCVCWTKSLSCVQLFVTPSTIACQASLSKEFSRQEYWSGLPFPSPGIFWTQGSKLGLSHCGQTLYHLNHQGSPPEEKPMD